MPTESTETSERGSASDKETTDFFSFFNLHFLSCSDQGISASCLSIPLPVVAASSSTYIK